MTFFQAVLANLARSGYGAKESSEEVLTKDVKNEVGITQFLGRNAFWYKKIGKNERGKIYAAVEWVSGKSLYSIGSNKFKKQAYLQRIHCLISAFEQMNKLHKVHQAHGDIHNGNWIVDFEKATMSLIDFGFSHRVGDRVFTRPVYPEPGRIKTASIPHDIYSMGVSCASMFPELFLVSDNPKVMQVKVVGLSAIEQAIVKLITALMNPSIDIRCTSEEALQFCQAIAEKSRYIKC